MSSFYPPSPYFKPLCAAVGFADIQSSNIVGYQNKALFDNFNFTIATFDKVDGSAMTFGDIKGDANVTYGGTIIQLLNDDGSTQELNIEGLGDAILAKFYYLDPTTAGMMSVDPGWYLEDDTTFEFCQNSREIPFGNGFLVEGGDASAALVYSGVVSKEKTRVPLHENFNFTGNCSPVTITFGDITCNEFATYGGTIIQLLNDDGSTQELNIEGLGDAILAKFYYLDPTTAGMMSVDPGWYLEDDSTFEFCQNAREILAGEGFLVEGGDAAAEIIIPPAL